MMISGLRKLDRHCEVAKPPKQSSSVGKTGLLRRFAPRNDDVVKSTYFISLLYELTGSRVRISREVDSRRTGATVAVNLPEIGALL
jgi:hypothetical protein